MNIEKIEYLASYGFKFTSNFKVMDLSGGFIGIDYNKETNKFGLFAKRNTYYYSEEDIKKIKLELDEKFKIITKLNNWN